MHAGDAYGIDCGKHIDDVGMAYGELDGRECDAAAGTVLSGADFERDECAGIVVWRQFRADVCWRAGRGERDYRWNAAGGGDLSDGFAAVWVGAGVAGELELAENTRSPD